MERRSRKPSPWDHRSKVAGGYGRSGVKTIGEKRSLALLKFDGKDGPVFFVIEHWPSEGEANDEFQGHARYFFEEHSCPTNWIGSCVAVIKDGDSDPHGFLEFVRALDKPPEFNDKSEDDLKKLFPEAFST